MRITFSTCRMSFRWNNKLLHNPPMALIQQRLNPVLNIQGGRRKNTSLLDWHFFLPFCFFLKGFHWSIKNYSQVHKAVKLFARPIHCFWMPFCLLLIRNIITLSSNVLEGLNRLIRTVINFYLMFWKD